MLPWPLGRGSGSVKLTPGPGCLPVPLPPPPPLPHTPGPAPCCCRELPWRVVVVLMAVGGAAVGDEGCWGINNVACGDSWRAMMDAPRMQDEPVICGLPPSGVCVCVCGVRCIMAAAGGAVVSHGEAVRVKTYNSQVFTGLGCCRNCNTTMPSAWPCSLSTVEKKKTKLDRQSPHHHHPFKCIHTHTHSLRAPGRRQGIRCGWA